MSQLRKHLKYTFQVRLRSFILKSKLGFLGERVYIEKNVNLMRYPKNIYINDNVVIKEGARLCPCNEDSVIRIGSRTTIGYMTFIFSSKEIVIGDDCLIAPFVYIVDSNHQIEKYKRINNQSNSCESIVIGDDVWIASNVTILKGVKINNGAVIAANSVINCEIGQYEIWGGTPAKKIGERK